MHYWSKVRVTSWFYEGMEGIVKLEFTKFFSRRKDYVVEIQLSDWPIKSTLQFIPESSLELIK